MDASKPYFRLFQGVWFFFHLNKLNSIRFIYRWGTLHFNLRYRLGVFGDGFWFFKHRRCRGLAINLYHIFSSWWFQPIWKICSSNWIISPGFGMKINNISNHHQVLVGILRQCRWIANYTHTGNVMTVRQHEIYSKLRSWQGKSNLRIRCYQMTPPDS